MIRHIIFLTQISEYKLQELVCFKMLPKTFSNENLNIGKDDFIVSPQGLQSNMKKTMSFSRYTSFCILFCIKVIFCAVIKIGALGSLENKTGIVTD